MKSGNIFLFGGSVIALCLAAAPAAAQVQETSSSDAAAAQENNDIIVSGSRIQRAGFDAPTPTTVISATELTQGNRPSIGEVLNDLPQFRATVTPTVTTANTASGNIIPDLRGLGTVRTLTLVNGHRFIGNAIDISILPVELIKRVDVVTGGASAAWGSGAVAGVVNIIMDDDFSGFRAGAEAGISSRGDGARYKGSLAWGGGFADGRGHFVIGGSYTQNESIFDRKSRRNVEAGTFRRADGSLIIANDVNSTQLYSGGSVLTAAGVPVLLSFNPNGSVSPFPVGSETVGTSTIGGGGQSFLETTAVGAEYQRGNVYARATYEVSDALKFWAEGTFNRTTGDYPFFSEPLVAVIQPRNAFLTPGAAAAITAAGIPAGTPFLLGRLLGDVSNGHGFSYRAARRTLEAAIGAQGNLGGGWSYDLYYDHGELRNDTSLYNQQITARVANAVDSLLVGGVPTCAINADANPANNDPACVPLNLLGSGNIDPRAAAYAFGNARSVSTTKLDAAGISLHGQAFSTWAGPVDVAGGADFRWEGLTSNYTDPVSQANGFSLVNFSPLSGKFDVKEFFGEVNVPLLNVADTVKLEVNGAARYSDYSTSGGIWSWKVGGTLNLMNDIKLRAVYSRDIRSPSIEEYYTPRLTGIQQVVDPFSNTSQQVNIYTGGNPALNPEVSRTLTLGGAYSPKFIPGLDISVDYFKIDIEGAIASLGAQDTLAQCFAANPGDPTCDGVVSRNGTAITSIISTYRNLSAYKTRGLDIEASYRMPLDRISRGTAGNLRLRAFATHLFELSIDGQERAGIVGDTTTFASPKWRVTGSVGYEDSDFSIDARARYVGGGLFLPPTTPANTPLNNKMSARTYVDLNVQFKLKDFTLFANVNNLFDVDPPYLTYTNPLYDSIGTYYSVGAKIKF